MNKIIISAIRSDEEFFAAIKAKPEMIFDLSPDIATVLPKLKRAHEKGKKLYIHIDLAKGVGKDESGIKYLHVLGVDGIISTKASLIKFAREQGLPTVQRFFILDSRSVETTIETMRSSCPDMIEIMPGVIPKIIKKLESLTDTPIIAGGLIETKDEMLDAFSAGADAVSTGKQSLWGEV